jgi:hypothetical protein
MKLQKRLNRKVGDKEYSKWVVILQDNHVDNLGWKEGTELQAASDPKTGSLTFKKSSRKLERAYLTARWFIA